MMHGQRAIDVMLEFWARADYARRGRSRSSDPQPSNPAALSEDQPLPSQDVGEERPTR